MCLYTTFSMRWFPLPSMSGVGATSLKCGIRSTTLVDLQRYNISSCFPYIIETAILGPALHITSILYSQDLARNDA